MFDFDDFGIIWMALKRQIQCNKYLFNPMILGLFNLIERSFGPYLFNWNSQSLLISKKNYHIKALKLTPICHANKSSTLLNGKFWKISSHIFMVNSNFVELGKIFANITKSLTEWSRNWARIYYLKWKGSFVYFI